MAIAPKDMETGDIATELHSLIWFGNLFSDADNDRYRALRAEYESRKASPSPAPTVDLPHHSHKFRDEAFCASFAA